MYHFIIICEFKLELQSGNENLGRDLCDLDLWPWPFAWTSLLSLVITPENFMMIGWWEHSQKGVTDRRTDRQTDGRTDGQTDWTIHRAAWSQLIKRNDSPVSELEQSRPWNNLKGTRTTNQQLYIIGMTWENSTSQMYIITSNDFWGESDLIIVISPSKPSCDDL